MLNYLKSVQKQIKKLDRFKEVLLSNIPANSSNTESCPTVCNNMSSFDQRYKCLKNCVEGKVMQVERNSVSVNMEKIINLDFDNLQDDDYVLIYDTLVEAKDTVDEEMMQKLVKFLDDRQVGQGNQQLQDLLDDMFVKSWQDIIFEEYHGVFNTPNISVVFIGYDDCPYSRNMERLLVEYNLDDKYKPVLMPRAEAVEWKNKIGYDGTMPIVFVLDKSQGKWEYIGGSSDFEKFLSSA